MAKAEYDLGRKYNIMTYETSTGKLKKVMLSDKYLSEWDRCWKEQEPFTYEVEGVVKGINPQYVVDFEFQAPRGAFDHIEDLSAAYGKVLPMRKEEPIQIVQPVVEVTAQVVDEIEEAMKKTAGYVTVPKITFKIECKCGATYPAKLRRDTRRCNCKYCSETVFVDYEQGLKHTKFGEGYVLTNNKYVNRNQEAPAKLQELPEI